VCIAAVSGAASFGLTIGDALAVHLIRVSASYGVELYVNEKVTPELFPLLFCQLVKAAFKASRCNWV
jgi:hypothetical protein